MQQSYRICSSMCAFAHRSEKGSQGYASTLNKASSRGNDKNSQGRFATLADPKRTFAWRCIWCSRAKSIFCASINSLPKISNTPPS